MSYDIYLREPRCEACGRGGGSPIDHNPTYNLTPIFDLALTGEPMPNPDVSEAGVVLFGQQTDRPRGLRVLSGRKAADTMTALENGLRRLRDPDWAARFRALEPENRWGTHADAIKVFEYLIKDAKEYPEHVWEIR